MMAPYRARRESTPPPEIPTTGLVAEMVRQFADPYAFLRELIQNGIDAGSTSLEVRIERGDDDVISTSVMDDGCGMTKEIIQGPFLTLFESSKEGDTKKIGKYGVGFVSVFSIQPDEVQVVTWRDGKSYLVRLFLDHSYEVIDAGSRPGSGTAVTLLKKQKLEEGADQFLLANHESLSLAALRTWCRHAQVPIHFTVADTKHGEEARRLRVDEPLSVPGPFSMELEIEGEHYALSISAGERHLESGSQNTAEHSSTYGGFFNRGLLLYETVQPLDDALWGFRFKVMSPHLKHTLSRDNVRRDEAFDRVISKVRELYRTVFRERLIAELGRRAQIAADQKQEKPWLAVLEAALWPKLSVKPSEVTLPLTNEVSGQKVMCGLDGHLHFGSPWLVKKPLLRGKPLLWARQKSPLTQALAEQGIAVVLQRENAMPSILEARFPMDIHEARWAYSLITPMPRSAYTADDQELSEMVRELLSAADVNLEQVGFCSVEGVVSSWLMVSVPANSGDKAAVFPVPKLSSWVTGPPSDGVLFLNQAHASVAVARKNFSRGKAAAAQILARLVLLDVNEEPLSPGDNHKLLEHAGKGVGR